MDKNTQDIIELIKISDLDETIKNILIRDLEKDGLTDFLREQIKAYCLEGIKKNNIIIENARQALESNQSSKTPA